MSGRGHRSVLVREPRWSLQALSDWVTGGIVGLVVAAWVLLDLLEPHEGPTARPHFVRMNA